MKTKRFLMIVLPILFFVGCAPSPETIQKAIEKTQTAMPTPTAINLGEIDLSEILITPGDLPAGYTASQIRDHGFITDEVEVGVINMMHQDLVFKDDFGGKISIYLYNSSGEAKKAFDFITSNIQESPNKIDGLGEDSVGESLYVPLIGGLDPIQASTVVFIRCKAVFYGELKSDKAYNGLVDYAKRLDERINKIVCN